MSSSAASPCVLDGVVVPDGMIALRADAEAFTHGEGLFESLPVVDGRPKFAAAHVRRLDLGARALGFGAGPTEATVREDVRLLAAAARTATFAMRLVLFRDGPRIRRVATAAPIPSDAGKDVALVVAAPAFNGPRTLAGMKTLNYLASRLAHQDAVRRGADEAVFTTHDGFVLEGTRSSIFIVERGRLLTPPTTLPILPSVTRDVLLAEARAAGMDVGEEPFTTARLAAADEAFIAASVRGPRAATTFEGRPVGSGARPATDALRRAYAAAFAAS